MMLHGFPMSAIEACKSTVSARQLKSLAGNAMHVESVGVMLLIALSMVNLDKLKDTPAPVSQLEETLAAFLRMDGEAMMATDDEHHDVTTSAVSKTMAKKKPAGSRAMKTVSKKKAGLSAKKMTICSVMKGKPAAKQAVMKTAKAKAKAVSKAQGSRRRLSRHYGKPSVFE